MIKKILGVSVMIALVIGVLVSSSIAESNSRAADSNRYGAYNVGIETTDAVSVDVSGANSKVKYIYGNADGSSTEKYEIHCKNAGGVFNACGSFCNEGEVCIASCAYTCEGVSTTGSAESTSKIIDVDSKIEAEKDPKSIKYRIKYGDVGGYYVDSDLEVRKIYDGKIEVVTSSGSTSVVSVKPEEAVSVAFGPETEGAEIRIEEKKYNNVPSVIYKIESEHSGKFLGILKINARYEAEVDANTGDVLDWNGPWWAFMIAGKPSEPVRSVVNNVDESDSAPSEPVKSVVDFESCVNAGYPVMESYPRQCKYEDMIFVEKELDESKYEYSEYQNCVDKGGKIHERKLWPKECRYMGLPYRQSEKEMMKECGNLGKVWNTKQFPGVGGGDAGGSGNNIETPYINHCITKEEYDSGEKRIKEYSKFCSDTDGTLKEHETGTDIKVKSWSCQWEGIPILDLQDKLSKVCTEKGGTWYPVSPSGGLYCSGYS